jgi:hypothetical protein
MTRRAKQSGAKPSSPAPEDAGGTDPRALRILLDTYGKRLGWNEEPSAPAEDFAYARSKGLMFDPVRCTHDEMCDRVVEACERVTPQEVARGFLASLGCNRLESRGALGSYAAFRHMPRHGYQPMDPPEAEHARVWCVVCGDMNSDRPHDLNWTNFHCFKQGCAYDSPLEAAFLLEQLALGTPPEPTGEGRRILRDVLDVASSLPATARPGALEKAVAKLLGTNKYVRQSLLESLSYCGVLQPRACPGYLHAFVDYGQRGYPPGQATEWSYPIRWWQGSDGVDTAAVKFWFPDLP